MEKEVWKDIPGYEWKYSVSNLWNVRSNNYRRTWKVKKLKLCDSRWYKRVNLSIYWRYDRCLIHRLVAICFLWYSELYVNHKNWIRNDNRVENLEWCTQSENIRHAIKYLWMWKNRKIKYWKNNPLYWTWKSVIQFTNTWIFIKKWDCVREAIEALNIKSIYKVIDKYEKTAGGFIWKYE